MHTFKYDDEWSVSHDGDFDGDIVFNQTTGTTTIGMAIPIDLLLEVVGRKIQYERIAQLEQENGWQTLRRETREQR